MKNLYIDGEVLKFDKHIKRNTLVKQYPNLYL